MRSNWTILSMLLLAAAPPATADFLEWKSGSLKLKGTGYFQGDVRAYPNWDVSEDDTTGTLREDATDVRRLRAGVEMELGDNLSGEIVFDANELLNSVIPPDDPGTAFSFRRDVRNAYLELALSKDHFVRAGHFKLPVSREFLTSAARTDFAERSLLANGLAPGRDWGVMLGGKVGDTTQLNYLVGGFAGDAWGEDIRGEWTGAARLVLELGKGLEIGTSGSLGTVDADPEDPIVDPQPKSLRGRSASGWSFFRRVHVDGSRRRLGADAALELGALTLRGEVLHGREDRKAQGSTFDDLPGLSALGWSASAVLRLMGREKGEAPLDLAVRYESLSFDDVGADEGFAGTGTRARNLRPQSSKAMSGGASYRPRDWVRLLASVVLDTYNDELLAPEIGRTGTYITVIGRLQLEVP